MRVEFLFANCQKQLIYPLQGETLILYGLTACKLTELCIIVSERVEQLHADFLSSCRHLAGLSSPFQH